jgi:hypothetical protein
MSSLNKRQHDAKYAQLKQIYPEQCAICGRDDKPLDIDRKDRQKGYGNIKNLQFLCRSCNCKKNPRGLSTRTLHRMGLQRIFDQPEIKSAEFKRNTKAEPTFRHWLYDLLRRKGWVILDAELVDSAAEACGCMQTTIQRYLKKVCSSVGFAEELSRAGEEPVAYLQFKEEVAKELGVQRLPPEILIDEGDLE